MARAHGGGPADAMLFTCRFDAGARLAELRRLAIPRFSQEEADEFDLQRNLQSARELELAAALRLREIRDAATVERGFASEQAMADADRAIDEMWLTFLRDAPNAATRAMLAGGFDQRARVLRHELGAHVEREKF